MNLIAIIGFTKPWFSPPPKKAEETKGEEARRERER